MNEPGVMPRTKMRAVRAAARAEAADRFERNRQAVIVAIEAGRQLMADTKFRAILIRIGVSDAPRLLMQKSAPNKDRKSAFGDPSLEFVIAWSFFKPLFEQPPVAEYLSKRQPEFVMRMKDAFISLVLDGPFPLTEAIGRPARSVIPSQRARVRRAGFSTKSG